MIRFVPGLNDHIYVWSEETVDEDRRPVVMFLPIKRLNSVLALRGNG